MAATGTAGTIIRLKSQPLVKSDVPVLGSYHPLGVRSEFRRSSC